MGKDDLAHLSSGWGLCRRPGYDVCYCAIFRGVNGATRKSYSSIISQRILVWKVDRLSRKCV